MICPERLGRNLLESLIMLYRAVLQRVIRRRGGRCRSARGNRLACLLIISPLLPGEGYCYMTRETLIRAFRRRSRSKHMQILRISSWPFGVTECLSHPYPPARLWPAAPEQFHIVGKVAIEGKNPTALLPQRSRDGSHKSQRLNHVGGYSHRRVQRDTATAQFRSINLLIYCFNSAVLRVCQR